MEEIMKTKSTSNLEVRSIKIKASIMTELIVKITRSINKLKSIMNKLTLEIVIPKI